MLRQAQREWLEMQDFYVYILRCWDSTYYVGHTADLDSRIGQHRAGTGSDYTRRRLPVRLVWAANFPTRDQAFCLERQLKRWSRAKKEAVIRGDWEALPGLAHTLRRGTHAEPVEASACSWSNTFDRRHGES